MRADSVESLDRFSGTCGQLSVCSEEMNERHDRRYVQKERTDSLASSLVHATQLVSSALQ